MDNRQSEKLTWAQMSLKHSTAKFKIHPLTKRAKINNGTDIFLNIQYKYIMIAFAEYISWLIHPNVHIKSIQS